MFIVPVEVKTGGVEGDCVFSTEEIKKGKCSAIFTHKATLITEKTYQQLQEAGEEYAIKTGVRLIEDIFLVKSILEPEEYINHSECPNMLYHNGMVFAKKDIQKGEELTINYRYFYAEKDVFAFQDNVTSEEVDGYYWQKALLHSTRELNSLIEEVYAEECANKDRIAAIEEAINIIKVGVENSDISKQIIRDLEQLKSS